MTGLPAVSMCGNPECGGRKACDRIPPEPLFGITDWLPADADPARVVRFFRSELAMAKATDTSGAAHVSPPGSFTVHKVGGTEGRPVRATPDTVGWTCVYSGPAASKDEALTGVPLWTQDLMQERLAALAAA